MTIQLVAPHADELSCSIEIEILEWNREMCIFLKFLLEKEGTSELGKEDFDKQEAILAR